MSAHQIKVYITLLAGFLLTLIAMGFLVLFCFGFLLFFFCGEWGLVWFWFGFLNINIEFVCLVTFPVLQLEVKQEDSTL